MGLSAALALLRPHVLVVGVPGAPMLRVHAEAAVRARGWVLVGAPEDADLLLVCGPTATAFAAAVDAAWGRVPVPRARRAVTAAAGLADALDSAARALEDEALQRRASAEAPPPSLPDAAQADGARFEPLARDWPAGLVLDCERDRRDRVVSVTARQLPMAPMADPAPLDPDVRAAALDLARAAGLLRLAGWAPPAARLDLAIDLLLTDRRPVAFRRLVRGVAVGVGRSATLRWSLERDAPGAGVHRRVLELLGPLADGGVPPARPDWPALLVGRPVSAVRLIAVAAYPGGGRA